MTLPFGSLREGGKGISHSVGTALVYLISIDFEGLKMAERARKAHSAVFYHSMRYSLLPFSVVIF